MKGLDYPVSSGEDTWVKRQKAIKKAFTAAEKVESTQILKSQVKELDQEAKETVRTHCEMARMCFNEGLDMYEDGDMTFPEFVEDLYKTLKAIDGKSSGE